MSQNNRPTEFSFGRQGNSCQEEESGIATISDSSDRTNPFITDPSKLAPFFKTSSNSSTVMAKPFTVPSMSVNQSRTNLTSFSFADTKTYLDASSSKKLDGRSVFGVFKCYDP
jgi:hypothetical protein